MGWFKDISLKLEREKKCNQTSRNQIDKIKERVKSMTDEELQNWCKSKECYDYLNR